MLIICLVKEYILPILRIDCEIFQRTVGTYSMLQAQLAPELQTNY